MDKRVIRLAFFLVLVVAIYFIGHDMIYPFLKGSDYFNQEKFQKIRGASSENLEKSNNEKEEDNEVEEEEIKIVKGRLNILVLGLDDVEGTSRSDTMILASLDLERGEVWLLSLPRDTRVMIEDHGLQKLGHAHVYGGADLIRKIISELIDVQIDYHVLLDYEGFKKIVDTMGGVEIDVEDTMFYEDKSAGFTIDLEPGRQRLNGEKALQYVRFRGDGNGDIGRIQRQMKFVRAAATEWINLSLIWKSPSVIKDICSSLSTDVPFAEIMALTGIAADFKNLKLFTAKLPGNDKDIDGISYWLMDDERTKVVVDKFFYGEGRPENPRIEVLNGSGVPGAAGKISAVLKEKGFNVVGVGDAWREDFKQILVVDKVGREDLANEVARLLGGTVVVDYGANAKYSDILVIVGIEEE